jgi:hypothetical protein
MPIEKTTTRTTVTRTTTTTPTPKEAPRRNPFGPVPAKPGSWEEEQRKRTGY